MNNENIQTPTVVIGWRERVSLPEWGIQGIRAKIDTGARTSSIHVASIERLDEERVRFEVVVHERPERVTNWVEAKLVRHSTVKPSSGERQRRIVCLTPITLAGQTFDAEISLVCRKGMLCRMLIGRTALAGRFVVDPSRKYLQGKQHSAKTRGNRL